MSKKKQSSDLDKNQRIKKHERSHSHDNSGQGMKRIKPHHKPAKKQHINILDAYEKLGEDYEDVFEDD